MRSTTSHHQLVQLHLWPANIGVATTYDGYGRLLILRQAQDGLYTRTCDAAQTNVYNGLDDRVSVTSASTVLRFLFDADGRMLADYGASTPARSARPSGAWLRRAELTRFA